MLILIAGNTRSSGKSCLAQNIAVHIQKNINDSVLLVDCEPQKDTSFWAQKRIQLHEASAINCVQLSGSIRQDLIFMCNHFDFLVVDCSVQDRQALEHGLSIANRVLMPVRLHKDSPEDICRMDSLASSGQQQNPRAHAAFVISQCPTLSCEQQRMQNADYVKNTCNLPVLNTHIGDRTVYRDSQLKGSSVLEDEPYGKAAQELRALFSELVFCHSPAIPPLSSSQYFVA